MNAEQVLTAQYEFTDDPIETDEIEGLNEAIERVRESHGKEFVRCESRVCDYDVYWNEKTNSVRIAAKPAQVCYEVEE